MVESGTRCTACEKAKTIVWRTDKSSKAILCNPCYLQKYPRPSKKDPEENGEPPPKKKRKQEPDPIVAPTNEEDEKMKEEDGKKKEKKSKKDPKVKAEVKDEVKDEVKEEELEQVKEELFEDEAKGETGDASKELDGLDNIFGAATEVSTETKSGSFREHALDQVNGEAPEVTADSDTEYNEVEANVGPTTIIVEASGQSKMDGKYDRLPKSSRGKPCYFSRKKDKIMFLYWSKMWRICADFGSSKSTAKVKDVEGLMDCCEPYPHIWQVYDKDAKEFKRIPAMRVFNAAVLSSQKQLPASLLKASSGTKSLSDGDGSVAEVATENKKKGKKKTKEPKQPKKDTEESQELQEKETVTDEAQAKTDAAIVADSKQEDEEGGTEKVPEVENDEEAPPNEAPSSNSSSSEKSSSSDDSSDEEKQPEAAAAVEQAPTKTCTCGAVVAATQKFCIECGARFPPAVDLAAEEEKKNAAEAAEAAAAAAQAAEREKKAVEFETKIRNEVQKVESPGDREKKLGQIKKMVASRKDALKQAAGMDEERIRLLIQSLERDFMPQKKSPRQPGAPPPTHLLKKKPDGQGEAQPTTPPDPDNDPDGPRHRYDQAPKGVLKARGAAKNQRRISIVADPSEDISRCEVQVTSYRFAGDTLWFQMPGSVVICDMCERNVSQSQGSLQGAYGQSQFAQWQFVCSDCAAR